MKVVLKVKVIFIKELKKQGHVNEVKEVSDGYAINFLIKNGYAVKYTKASSDILKKDIKRQEIEDTEQQQKALEIKKKIENITLDFYVKSHQGKMFGSINSKQISDKLKEQGIVVDKKNIDCDGLSTLGMHDVLVKLYKKVSANLKVHILEK